MTRGLDPDDAVTVGTAIWIALVVIVTIVIIVVVGAK